MRIKSSIKKEHPHDKIVRRKRHLYRINKVEPSRKARQG